MWFVVGGYLTRWRIEDTIRFVKQAYKLEDIRVMKYVRLKNLVALVLAASYFTSENPVDRCRAEDVYSNFWRRLLGNHRNGRPFPNTCESSAVSLDGTPTMGAESDAGDKHFRRKERFE